MIAQELNDVFIETREPNWDGFNALPTSAQSLALAKRFTAQIDDFPIQPTAGAEPDGCLTMEWYAGPWQKVPPKL